MAGIDSSKLIRWFEAHAASAVLYARQWLERSAAEDVVQEVFVRLLAQSREPANVRAWLYRSVRNAAISTARSQRRREKREQRSAADRPAWFEVKFDQPIDARLAEEALATLPQDQREIVVLRIWGQMTLAEVAELTGAAVSTVHEQYHAALAKMKRALQSPCDRSDHERPRERT